MNTAIEQSGQSGRDTFFHDDENGSIRGRTMRAQIVRADQLLQREAAVMRRRLKLSLGLAILGLAAAMVPLTVQAQVRGGGWVPTAPSASLPLAVPRPEPSARTQGQLRKVAYMRPSILPEPARVIVRRRSSLPVGPLYDFYLSKYREAKAGSADAVYQIGLVLKECAQFDATPQALNASIRRVQQTGRMNGLATDPAWAVGELQRRFARCRGIPASDRSRYWDVMVEAAQRGSVEALESMAFQMPPDEICRERELHMCKGEAKAQTLHHRQRQAAWLQQAQRSGSLNALWLLGAAYLNGEMAARDKSEAYVYLRAYEIVAETFRLEVEGKQLIADLKQSMGPATRASAEARAQALVNDPDCCVYIR